MDNPLYYIIAALLLILSLQLLLSHIQRKQWLKHIEDKEKTWLVERKDLLDRLQAPSFAEYTNKLIKEKKAEQPEEKVDPVEFVS